MQLARDVMQREVLTIPAAMPFVEVVRLIVVAGIHGAPVVDDRGAVIGVISAMDLLRAIEEAYDDERDEGEGADPLEQLRSTCAGKLASPEATWVTPETSAGELARVMHEAGTHRVLVGSDGRLDGVVTAFDLLRLVPSA